MPTAGPIKPAVVANVADGFGIYNWQVSAACPGGGGNTQQLRLTGAGFALPANAVIQSIRLVVTRRASQLDTDYAVTDDLIRLLKAGVPSGPNAARPGVFWPTAFAAAAYDFDGAGWTPADVNDPGFGCVIRANQISPEGAFAASHVSGATLTVEYEVP